MLQPGPRRENMIRDWTVFYLGRELPMFPWPLAERSDLARMRYFLVPRDPVDLANMARFGLASIAASDKLVLAVRHGQSTAAR